MNLSYPQYLHTVHCCSKKTLEFSVNIKIINDICIIDEQVAKFKLR